MSGDSRASQQQARHNTSATAPRPFVDNGTGDYFAGDDERQQKIDLLSHLLPYGGVFVILGEHGVGKTVLLQHLQSRLSESCRFCRLGADDCDDPREFIHKILDCFAWRSDAERSLGGTQLRAVREHLGILRRNGYAPVLMIDDADRLSDPAFEVLEQLFDDDDPNLLSLVLSGDDTLKKRLASPLLQPLNVHIAHELQLAPFSPAEQAEYIRTRLGWAGIDDMGPFQTATLKFIYAASRGVPRRINELAQVFWDNKKDGQGRDSRRSGRRQWLGQLRYIAPIVLISLGVALFNEPIRTALFSSPKTPPTPPAAGMASQPAMTESPTPTLAQNSGDDVAAAPARVERSAEEAAAPDAVSQVPASTTRESTPAGERRADGVVSPSGGAAAAASATATAEQQTLPDRTPADADSADAQKPAEMNAANMAAVSDDAPAPTPIPAKSRQHQADGATAESEQGQWWLSQPADQYAVQLISIDARTARRYVQQHELEDSVNPFRVKRRDGDLVALAVGPFANRTAAAAEALRWQQRLPGLNPFVRTVASIQQTVRRMTAPSASEWLARVLANEQQLLQAPPGDYAVQLLATDRDGMTDFVSKHGLTGKVVYFRTRVNGQERYAALMAGYADRQQALAAGQRIAAEADGIQPWVRRLASIQQVIRSNTTEPAR